MFEETPLVIVEDQDTLLKVAEKLVQSNVVGVDTEADSFYHYQEKVCLIQFSDLHTDYIVDPLALDDLSALAPLFERRDICKIFHGADYDVVSLKRDFGWKIRGVFDTMITAQMLGMPRVGLADLIHELFGTKLEKKYQRHDWSRRPLLQEHIDYARGDTHWLAAIREILMRRLRAAGRLGHVREECRLVEKRTWDRPAANPNGYLWVKRASDLDPTGLRVLRRLWLYREEQARSLDRPTFKVISDSVLVELARTRPTTAEGVGRILPGRGSLQRRHGRALLEGILAGLEDEFPIPRKRRKKKKRREAPPPPSSGLTGRRAERAVGALRTWRNALVEERPELTPFTVASNTVLTNIARYRPASLEDLREVPEVRRWQVADFGEAILAVLDEVDPPRGNT